MRVVAFEGLHPCNLFRGLGPTPDDDEGASGSGQEEPGRKGEDGGSVVLAAAHPHPGEQVSQAHAVGEVLEGDQVVHVGLDALPPPP